jgi:pantoate kinase
MKTQLTVWYERNCMGHYEYNVGGGYSTSGKTALKDLLAYAAKLGYASVLVLKGRKEIEYLVK